MTRHATFILTAFLTLTACTWTDKQTDWNDWTSLEKKYSDNKIAFDTLTNWLTSNIHFGQPTFVHIDSLPKDKQKLLDSLGIQTILMENYFCSVTDTRGGKRLTYQFNEPADKKIYSYLLFARCIPTELKNLIETNGTYKNINDNWHLIQKKYDWFFADNTDRRKKTVHNKSYKTYAVL